jgi:hypothetical protein
VSGERIGSFAEFWPYYLGEHRRPGTRALHLIGTTLALGFLVVAVVQRLPWLLLGALLSGYAFAWVGHFAVEHNRPATFRYPMWSLAADWKMWGLAVTGGLGPELRRAGVGDETASTSRP